MSKIEPINVAKWFIGQNISGLDDSQEGNTKLQKLIFFAQLIYMCKNDNEVMFEQEFSAFKNGMVLNDIRNNYKRNYKKLKEDCNDIEVPKDIEEILTLTKQIFGNYSAEELSKMSHEFETWQNHYESSKGIFGYNYSKAKIPYDELRQELYRMKKVLKAYETTSNIPYNEEEDY
ncbi:MAG: Panacea domain-containing protein [Clostridia bacterium]